MATSTDNFTIKQTHPAFAGHFPENPVVPGVVILEQVMLKWQDVNGRKIQGFDYAKFINPLRPDTPCYIRFSATTSSLKTDYVVKTLAKLTICKGRLIHA